jgi:hypothetical protein
MGCVKYMEALLMLMIKEIEGNHQIFFNHLPAIF